MKVVWVFLLAGWVTVGWHIGEFLRRAEREHVIRCYQKYNDGSANAEYKITLCVERLEK